MGRAFVRSRGRRIALSYRERLSKRSYDASDVVRREMRVERDAYRVPREVFRNIERPRAPPPIEPSAAAASMITGTPVVALNASHAATGSLAPNTATGITASMRSCSSAAPVSYTHLTLPTNSRV